MQCNFQKVCAYVDRDVREEVSYSEQFQRLKGSTDCAVLKTSHPKPSRAAQAKVKGAHKITFSDDIYAKSEARPVLNLETQIPEKVATIQHAVFCMVRMMRLIFLLVVHTIAVIYGCT